MHNATFVSMQISADDFTGAAGLVKRLDTHLRGRASGNDGDGSRDGKTNSPPFRITERRAVGYNETGSSQTRPPTRRRD